MNLYDQLKDPVAMLVFILTLILPILVGFLTLKRTKNQADFFVGGRSMNKFVVALSAVSSGRSSWLVLGLCGMAYTRGVSAVWAVVGYIVVEMFQFIYIGRRLREKSQEYNSITLLDYFESRFKDKSGVLRFVGVIIITIFLTAYVAAQFNAGGKALSTALDIPLIYALIISAVLVLVYMLLGGFIAVAYNDVIRAIILIVGLVIFPVYGLIRIGGLSALLKILSGLNPAFIDPFSIAVGGLIGFLGIGLGSPGQPHIVVRYMSVDNADKLRFSSVIGTFWNVVMGWGAIFIGLIGRGFFTSVDQLPGQNPEIVYLTLASRFFGPVIYGLLIGGIFAAILSTADSQLLVVSSTIIRDLYEKIIREKFKKSNQELSEKKKLFLSRLVVLFTGIVAVFLAFIAKDLVFWLVLFAWGGLGASFGSALIFSLYWKRTTRTAVILGMVSGTVTVILWKLFLSKSTGVYELIPAFLVSSLFIIIVSLLKRENSKS
jgi:sodium/proline symporter